MRATELIPIVEEAVAPPASPVAKALVWLALDDGRPVVGWDELRAWLSLDLDVSTEDADRLILQAVDNGEADARIGYESTWRIRASATAARALLLRYALNRLDDNQLHVADADAYEGPDRWLVMQMVPELLEFAAQRVPEPDAAHYRRVLKRAADA